MKLGIVGCGNIGTELALFAAKNTNVKKIILHDINKKAVEELIARIKQENKIVVKATELEQLVKASDIVVEAAHPSVVGRILEHCIFYKHKHVMIMSSGGLVGKEKLIARLEKAGVNLYIPSGAIAGLDALSAVKGRINKLTLTTTKPAKSIISEKINRRKKMFEGSVDEAIKLFPKNINVAATLLYYTSFKNIKVRIFADPRAKLNTHQIVAEGNFGRITVKTENKPSRNPKTSYLAVLSAFKLLGDLLNNC